MDLSVKDPGVKLLTMLVSCHSIAKRVAEHANLTLDEVLCLFVIFRWKPGNIKELSQFLGVRSSRTSKILYVLEERGYVTRAMSLADHRMEEVSLSERGTDLVGKVIEYARQSATAIAVSEVRESVSRSVTREGGEVAPGHH